MASGNISLTKHDYIPQRFDIRKVDIVINKIYSKLLIAREFFFGEGLIGYSHPILTERIANIREYQST